VTLNAWWPPVDVWRRYPVPGTQVAEIGNELGKEALRGGVGREGAGDADLVADEGPAPDVAFQALGDEGAAATADLWKVGRLNGRQYAIDARPRSHLNG
jgi:hypothetical protein